MHLDPDACYRTLLSKDRRFDGWFFVGVSSTGIYCRPVCPVRTPKRQNCHFFTNAAAAEQAGFRPCMRCRPELAPGNGLLDISGRLAQAAATLIEEGFLDTGSVSELAARVGVSDRHLRRIFDAEYGVPIIEFAQTQRLLMAKRLLTDTPLPVGTVASAAGFGSVRRLNDLFQKRYGLSPLRFRKDTDVVHAESMTFAIGYRPPFDWSGILTFLSRNGIAGVERIDNETYERTVAFSRNGRDVAGWIRVAHVPQRYALNVTLSMSLTPVVTQVLGRVRRLFDLASRPDLIDAHLGSLAAGAPGLRVPGALDGFEIAARAIAVQQMTVSDAGAILSCMAARFGAKVAAPSGLNYTFPSAATISRLPLAALAETGLTRTHAQALAAVALEIASGRLTLEPAAPLEETLAALRRIHDMGEWAVQYIAMRALGWPNAFPDEDAALKKQLGCSSTAELNRRAEPWQPWRAYATLHIWRQYEEQS